MNSEQQSMTMCRAEKPTPQLHVITPGYPNRTDRTCVGARTVAAGLTKLAEAGAAFPGGLRLIESWREVARTQVEVRTGARAASACTRTRQGPMREAVGLPVRGFGPGAGRSWVWTIGKAS